MKIIKNILVLLLLSFMSCKEVKNETKSKSPEKAVQLSSSNATYKIDVDNSIITWKGFTPVDGHNGTIRLEEGNVGFENDKLKAGHFKIDMNSISVLDLKDAEENSDLVGHLKEPDFFEVEKFSHSEFEITNVLVRDAQTFIQGNFTLKGITKNIEIPVIVNKDEQKISIISEPFNIDRTEWGIIYDSKNFFENLKDEFIKDNIEISFKIKSTVIKQRY